MTYFTSDLSTERAARGLCLAYKIDLVKLAELGRAGPGRIDPMLHLKFKMLNTRIPPEGAL